MTLHANFIFILAALSFSVSSANAGNSCGDSREKPIEISINPSIVVRESVPKSLFGFTLDWYQFQLGHMRDWEVRPEVFAWLRPFKGAAYRYSGGNRLEWRKMVGPYSSRQPVNAGFNQWKMPIFGPLEFIEFIKNVDGRGIVLLNFTGDSKSKDAGYVDSENIEFISWINSKISQVCADGVACGVDAYELGNEMDWESGVRWPEDIYASRMTDFLQKATKEFPNARFVANGRTAPWGKGGVGYNEKSFDEVVSRKIGKFVSGVSIHPYYDGLPVSEMTRHMVKLRDTYAQTNKSIGVFVTEHGRWPSEKKGGRWEDNWYQASGGWGGVSTSDFVLSTIQLPFVSFSTWHSMAVRSPWQLFHLNKATDRLYPSPVYWSLRSIREGMLNDAVETKPDMVLGGDYSGQYKLRLIGMRDDVGAVSVLGVNRSSHDVLVRISIKGVDVSNRVAVKKTFVSDIYGADNTDQEPYKHQMETVSYRPEGEGDLYCVSRMSSFSIVYR